MNQESVDREVVSIGLDFRPLPVNIGDGIIWKFNPDPDPDVWGTLMDSLKMAGGLAKLNSDNPAEAAADVDVTGMIGALKAALASMLVDDTQRQEWEAKRYGLAALSGTASVVVKSLSGFPTK